MFTGYKMNQDKLDENKKLIEKYPFLEIKDSEWWNPISKSNDILYTWLDDLEPGWREVFGECLCKELARALKEDECENKFHFLQIKEKFGSLRLYATGYGDKTKEVLAKYEELSKYICGHCGKTATKITTGYIYPFCDDCIEKVNDDYVNVWEFYGMDSKEDVDKEIENILNYFKYDEYWTSFRKELEQESNE